MRGFVACAIYDIDLLSARDIVRYSFSCIRIESAARDSSEWSKWKNACIDHHIYGRIHNLCHAMYDNSGDHLPAAHL